MAKKNKFMDLIKNISIPGVFSAALYWIYNNAAVEPKGMLMVFTLLSAVGIAANTLHTFNVGKPNKIRTILSSGMFLIPTYLFLGGIDFGLPFVNFGQTGSMLISLVVVTGGSIKGYMSIK